MNARTAAAYVLLTTFLAAPVQAAEAPGGALRDAPAPLASPAPADDATPPPVAHTGDLTHLVFTAREGLVAALVAPAAGGVVGTPVTKVVVQTVEGAGVELSVDGSVVPATQLGERAVDGAAHTARYSYYGVPFKAGPNDVAVTALGADGLRGAVTHYRIDGAGKPVAVRAALAGRLVADGRTPATLTIAAVDALGHGARADTQVIVAVRSGDVRLALPGDDRAPGANAVKLSLGAGGKATVLVLPGATSGNFALDVIAGDVKTTAGAFVAPFLRHAIVTGLVSGGLGATPGDEDGDGNVDGGASRRGRVAISASGEAFERISLTFAYDTASRLAPLPGLGPFVADPAARPNQTYGDASTQRDDTVSSARLFARIEDGHDAFTYGQFNADLGGGEASATSYHQLLDGARLQLADNGERAHATLFDARNDVAYARQTFAVSGLAALGTTLQPNIVPGSDVVTLVALDRRTGAPVSQTVLEPNVDYVLDDAVGSLRFIQVPLPFDAALDPQVVVVQYQYTGGATQSRTTGASTSLRLGPTAGAPAVRVGYVNDVSGAGNFAIFEQAIGGALHGGAWSLVHADASGVAGETGGALATGSGASTHFAFAEASHALHLTLGYDTTSAGYQNPFGGFATPGLTDLRAVLMHPLHDAGELSLTFDGQANRGLGSDTSQSQASLDWKQRYGRLKAHGGLALRRQNQPAAPAILPSPAPDGSIPALGPGSLVATGPAIASSATQATVGADYALGAKSTLSLVRIQDISGSANAAITQPSQTTAGIDLAVDHSTHAYLRSSWSAAPQIGFAESTAALTSGSGTRITTFGIDRAVGPNTTLTTQWALQDTGSASDVYATNGVRERLLFGNGLKGDAFFQTSQDDGAGGGEFSVYGASLAWGDKRFHASSAFQNRTGVAPGFDLQLGAGGALGGGVSLLGHLDDAVTAGLHDIDARVGLAWRPERDDRGASLLELERQTGNLTDGQELADTLAFDEAYRPGGRLEIDGRLAYKLDGDTYYAAHSELFGLRVAQRIGPAYDLAAETRTLRVPGIAGAVQTGFALEAGARVADTLRLALGYAFSGAADPSLFAAPTRRGAYVTATSVIDRIFGWGR